MNTVVKTRSTNEKEAGEVSDVDKVINEAKEKINEAPVAKTYV
jgi:hypothetical protein